MIVTNTEQVAIYLMLGTMITLFAMFERPHNVYTLCQQTLIRLRSVYENSPNLGPNQSFFLTDTAMLEMIGSLIHGAVPSLKIRPPEDPYYVDRYLGLSTSLLPIPFQICGLNWTVSSAGHEEGDFNRIPVFLTQHGNPVSHLTSSSIDLHPICPTSRIMNLVA